MLSMYPSQGIHFRNPFNHSRRSSQFGQYNYDLDVQSPSGSAKVTFPAKRPLTPPPDMNSVATHMQPPPYHYYGERVAPASANTAPAPAPAPVHASTPCTYQTSNRKSEPPAYVQNQIQLPRPDASLKPASPIYQPHPVHFTSAVDPGSSQGRDSQLNAIAPSLQIPRSVNSSQGSIAELAAQITCLFWFESSTTLELADDGATTYKVQALEQDAIPTTGFRKWVTTILSTTQVTQNVIILALLFIYRLKKLNPSVRGKPGSEYRLLTVALMLGNKFLDDNTYTNKTWAEVSGISVAEVHIMEVEFLSNMKYALFTSAEEWAIWQNRLGRFASFFDRASRPLPQLVPTLPSPPASNHASPPYHGFHAPAPASYPHQPSPHGPAPDLASKPSRKRSLDNYTEPPAKRVAPSYATPASNQHQYLPRVTLPSLGVPQHQHMQSLPPQLPPISYAQRSLGPMPQPPTTSWTQTPPIAAPSQLTTPVPSASVAQSGVQSRHQSPYPGSAAVSPTEGLQPHMSQLSPSFFLAQRNSPYRPVRGVSTLLVPPPSRALHQPQNVGREQMHYQPLGRPGERQQGRLPYIESQWFEGNPASTSQWYTQPHLPPPNFYGRV